MSNSVSSERQLIVVELNEINMDVAARYASVLPLPAISQLMSLGMVHTTSERQYEQLEPWIQWVSARTGKTAREHGIFRLGDAVGAGVPQLYEQLAEAGVTVGAVSPMNAENRLRTPRYFLPDPWTNTPSDDSFWSRSLTRVLQQAVNDNAQSRLTVKSLAILLLALLRFARLKHYARYISLALGSMRGQWRKALLLDLFLHDLHWGLVKRHRPQYSTVFLNAGAHIQHHYFFSSSQAGKSKGQANPDWYISATDDPVAEMLQVYDAILADYLTLEDVSVIVATGLSQVPYDKAKYYWRLKNHVDFLRLLDVKFVKVSPRMTRDFLIEFSGRDEATVAEKRLRKICEAESGEPIFGEIDNRGDTLFVTLTWGHDVPEEMSIRVDDYLIPLRPHVAFVAMKNGMHCETGYAFFVGDVKRFAPSDGTHVSKLFDTTRRFFGFDCEPWDE